MQKKKLFEILKFQRISVSFRHSSPRSAAAAVSVLGLSSLPRQLPPPHSTAPSLRHVGLDPGPLPRGMMKPPLDSGSRRATVMPATEVTVASAAACVFPVTHTPDGFRASCVWPVSSDHNWEQLSPLRPPHHTRTTHRT